MHIFMAKERPATFLLLDCVDRVDAQDRSYLGPLHQTKHLTAAFFFVIRYI